MKRRTIIGIAILAAALIAGGGYAYYRKSMENEAAKDVSTVVAERMNISRSGLFAKLKLLADVTPNEMIQVVRLRHAARLLREGKYRVNEVCYMVGFSSPSYFSKCFSKQFGVKPAEYK